MLYRYNGTIFTQSEVLDYFDEEDDFVFYEKDGLRFAVALVHESFNPAKLKELDQLVELKASMVNVDNLEVSTTDIPMHRCSWEELSEFYPITHSQSLYLDGFWFVMRTYCLDMSQVKISGNEFSPS